MTSKFLRVVAPEKSVMSPETVDALAQFLRRLTLGRLYSEPTLITYRAGLSDQFITHAIAELPSSTSLCRAIIAGRDTLSFAPHGDYDIVPASRLLRPPRASLTDLRGHLRTIVGARDEPNLPLWNFDVTRLSKPMLVPCDDDEQITAILNGIPSSTPQDISQLLLILHFANPLAAELTKNLLSNLGRWRPGEKSGHLPLVIWIHTSLRGGGRVLLNQVRNVILVDPTLPEIRCVDEVQYNKMRIDQLRTKRTHSRPLIMAHGPCVSDRETWTSLHRTTQYVRTLR